MKNIFTQLPIFKQMAHNQFNTQINPSNKSIKYKSDIYATVKIYCVNINVMCNLMTLNIIINMKEKVENIFNQLEQTKDSLMTRLDEIDSVLLQKKPSDENWSIVQIISHLEKIESGTLKYIEKKNRCG